jgi:hypothetical protein
MKVLSISQQRSIPKVFCGKVTNLLHILNILPLSATQELLVAFHQHVLLHKLVRYTQGLVAKILLLIS